MSSEEPCGRTGDSDECQQQSLRVLNVHPRTSVRECSGSARSRSWPCRRGSTAPGTRGRTARLLQAARRTERQDMSDTQSRSSEVEVRLDPDTAFTAFTEGLDRWWVRGPITATAPAISWRSGAPGKHLAWQRFDPPTTTRSSTARRCRGRHQRRPTRVAPLPALIETATTTGSTGCAGAGRSACAYNLAGRWGAANLDAPRRSRGQSLCEAS